ncbi:MutS-like protein [Modicella reniformis]|uniref:MutS-like protein n=1 Tax=Modicella reniformis TaxID=1440133 RepID=A0A9P6J0C4_9FUNG|nr:MutS-like protein [Modicella reniformis]
MIPDLHRLSKRFQRGVASLQDVVRVYQVVVRLPGLVSTLASCETGSKEHKEMLDAEFTAHFDVYTENLKKLQQLVETTIDLEAVDRHEYLIKAEFDQNLKVLRSKMETVKQTMEKEHQRVADELNMEVDKKLKMEDHQVYGWSFRLSRNDSSCLRNKSKYIELTTQKNGVLFTSTKMREASQSFSEASQEYERTQSSLAKEVIGIVATYCPVLEKLNTMVAQLDVLVSFAHVSVHAPLPYVKPHITAMGTGNVILKESRHPCLEVQEDVAFIPNDVNLVRGKTEFLIITGPNMGGKSTYIRQSATVNSLIVIDELGRGTSTYDGFGLAWAISEHIATEVKSFCLFATHFHELTSLGETAPHVGNLHVTAHVGGSDEGDLGGGSKSHDITLLYKVVEGVCDQSFGIHVAELAQFPDSVVQLAKRKAIELEDFSTQHSASGTIRKDGETAPLSKRAKADIETGTALVEEIIQALTKEFDQIETQGSVIEKDHETMLCKIKKVRDHYKNQIKANSWLQEQLTGIYWD